MLTNRGSGGVCTGVRFLWFWLALNCVTGPAFAQSLNLPPRPTDAPNGTQFTNIISHLSRDERENWIYAQVLSGNVPDWLRALKPISVSAAGHTATYYVTPDYLAVGSDTDYFLAPCTPILAQRLATHLGCSLPTRRMVNQIWTNAAVKLNPQPIPPSAEMITVPVFAWHNFMVRTQRNAFTNSQPLGALVSGDKKDVILSNETTNRPPPARVTIYGWHYPTGEPIQPLSAVHESTYADYSHGIRLVQMNLTADGVPNTVSNVLRSASLSPLLSDEGLIPLPHYGVAPLSPIVMKHPRSQSLFAGGNVTLDTLAIGNAPLSYRWLFNSGTITDATNSSLSITNLTGNHSGNYAVIVNNPAGSTTSRVAVLRVRTNALPVVFADDFDANTAAHWSLFWGAANDVPDHDLGWSFDYGAIPYTFNGVTALIPPAPNSPNGSTRALRLAVNQNDSIATNAAVNLYPKNQVFSGDFTLKFDLWIQYPGNAGGTGTGVAGSTQHGIFGINHLGTNVNWAAATTTASDGLWFGVSGEGGESKDYRAYAGNLSGLPTELSFSNNTAAIYQNLFPAARFETAGAPGKNWVEVEVRYTNHVVLWLMDGTVISQRTNATSFTNGNLMIGLMDVFPTIASPARDSFALFDNLRVENLAPPPIQFLSAARETNGLVSLTLASVAGDQYWIDTSTNLTDWQPIAFTSATNATHVVVDPNTTDFPSRFYRARR